jgi:hypothetical protein
MTGAGIDVSFPEVAEPRGWVRFGLDRVLLELVRRVHKGLTTPAEADIRLAALGYATSAAQFHELVEEEIRRPFFPFSLAMAWVSAREEPAAAQLYCLYRTWGNSLFLTEPGLVRSRNELLTAARQGRVDIRGRTGPSASHLKIDSLECLGLRLVRCGNHDRFSRDDGSVAYYDVVVGAKEIRALWPKLRPVEEKKRFTMAAETAAFRRLVELMRQRPNQPSPKAELIKLFNISERGLNRIFSLAAEEANTPAWLAPGRRKKFKQDPSPESPHP